MLWLRTVPRRQVELLQGNWKGRSTGERLPSHLSASRMGRTWWSFPGHPVELPPVPRVGWGQHTVTSPPPSAGTVTSEHTTIIISTLHSEPLGVLGSATIWPSCPQGPHNSPTSRAATQRPTCLGKYGRAKFSSLVVRHEPIPCPALSSLSV